MQEVTPELLAAFKERMHITHGAEDDNLNRLLSFSISALKRDCGEFDVYTDETGRELVFERTRYAYNDSLEFFNDNFLSQINSFSISLLPNPVTTEEGDAV